MNQEQLQAYYRRRVALGNSVLAQTPPEHRDKVDFDNGYWHERAILQRLIEHSGVPVCYGAIDCLEPPTTTCLNTRHSTCPRHIYSCYLCVEVDASPSSS